MKRKGFTLIELLVVIAIIAILAAILFPVFSKLKERSLQAKCLNNLKQLASAVESYKNDNYGWMPSAGAYAVALSGRKMNDWCGSNSTGVEIFPEKGTIWRYTGTKGIYKCGTDKKKPAQYPPTGGDWPLSYSMNCEGCDVAIESSAIRKTTRWMLFIHEARETINDGLYRPQTDYISNIHYEGTTIVYLDGHAAWKTKIALQKEHDDGWWATQFNPDGTPKYR